LASDLLTICGENAYLYTSEEILQEIRSTLIEKRRIRNKYLYSDQDVEDFIETFIEMSTIIENLPDIHVIERDPEDNKILACALTAYADYIVSRDLDLLDLKIYNRIKIIAPEDFIWYLRSI